MKFGRKTGKDDETAANPDPEAGKPVVEVSVNSVRPRQGQDSRC